MTQGLTDGVETVVKIDEIKSLQGNTPTITGNMYAWNQKGGVTASSTKNMTGVYDLSGGTYERMASYIANNNVRLLINGESLTYEGGKLKSINTKYTMVYPHDENEDNTLKEETEENAQEANKANYMKNTKIYGDSIREISTAGIGSTSWENDGSSFLGLYGPFMVRGGSLKESSDAGIFSFSIHDGSAFYPVGFRAVVVATL